MSNATKPGTPTTTNKDEIVHHIPLSDIFIDYDWNGRSKANVMSDASDAVQDTTVRGLHQALGEGLKGLRLTLRMRGQDTPVIVRPVENGKSLGGKKTDKPLELVAGFRRATAIGLLLESEEDRKLLKVSGQKTMVPGLVDGTIKAFIRQCTPVEARLLNGRENTDRQNLTTQDHLKLVIELQKFGLNQSQIGEELGITQGYVSKLLKISTLPAQILNHWRGSAKLPGLPPGVSASLNTTELLELQAMATKNDPPMTEGETVKRYIQMLSPPTPEEGGSADKDPVAERVKKAATLAAGLVKNGVFDNGNLEWARVIGPKADGYLIDTGKMPIAERGKYWELASDTFKKVIDEKPKSNGSAEAGAGSEAAGT
jgi:hypothetical protein